MSNTKQILAAVILTSGIGTMAFSSGPAFANAAGTCPAMQRTQPTSSCSGQPPVSYGNTCPGTKAPSWTNGARRTPSCANANRMTAGRQNEQRGRATGKGCGSGDRRNDRRQDEHRQGGATDCADRTPSETHRDDADTANGSDVQGSFRDRFLGLINAWRKENGKNVLAYDAKLDQAATGHSTWMQTTGNFSHTGADNSQFFKRCTQAGGSCDAENIAYGFTSAQQLFDMWKNSPGHNANMLGDHTVMGLGLVGKYATNDFR